MTDARKPLDELFQRYREALSPDSAALRRLHGKIRTSMEASHDLKLATLDTSSSGSPTRWGAPWRTWAAVAGACMVVAGLTSLFVSMQPRRLEHDAGGELGLAAHVEERAQSHENARVRQPALSPEHTTVETLADPPLTAIDSNSQTSDPPGPTKRRTSTDRSRMISLGPEMELLVGAREALQMGHTKEALKLLQEHDHRYPNTRFLHERELLVIQAMCRSGQRERARARIEKFLATYSNAALADAVRAACP